MAKTRNLKRRKLNTNDYISSLPNDILLNILSKLEMKEQARTSTLSTRWRTLWTLNNTRFNIDASDIPIAELIQGTKGGRMRARRFVTTADQILRLQSHQTIDELKINYFKGTLSDPLELDGWIEIARAKQVKSLRLNFKPFRNKSLPLLSLGSTPFSSLATLRLEYASLSSHTIHCILCSSPNLMDLSILRAVGFLENLKISGSSIKLKHLELIDNHIDLLEISAPNLVSFSFGKAQWRTKICFKSTPQLTHLSCYEGLSSNTWLDYRVLLPQLATLTLTLSSGSAIPIFPTMKSLKQMQVTLFVDVKGVLGLFSGLFRAAPCLQRLLLDFRICMHPLLLRDDFVENYEDHKFLEEIEIGNFGGSDTQVQLVICIAKCSPSLRKIIIHPIMCKIGYIKSLVENLPSRLPQKELDISLKVRNAFNE